MCASQGGRETQRLGESSPCTHTHSLPICAYILIQTQRASLVHVHTSLVYICKRAVHTYTHAPLSQALYMHIYMYTGSELFSHNYSCYIYTHIYIGRYAYIFIETSHTLLSRYMYAYIHTYRESERCTQGSLSLYMPIYAYRRIQNWGGESECMLCKHTNNSLTTHTHIYMYAYILTDMGARDLFFLTHTLLSQPLCICTYTQSY